MTTTIDDDKVMTAAVEAADEKHGMKAMEGIVRDAARRSGYKLVRLRKVPHRNAPGYQLEHPGKGCLLPNSSLADLHAAVPWLGLYLALRELDWWREDLMDDGATAEQLAAFEAAAMPEVKADRDAAWRDRDDDERVWGLGLLRALATMGDLGRLND